MPRCYMVKKALCNKYINSVARGFEDWGVRCRSPTPPLLPTIERQQQQQQPLLQPPPEQPPPPPPPLPPPPPPPTSQQQQQPEKTKLPAPKPRYASPVASVHDYSPKQSDISPSSGLSRTKEHVPVIVSTVSLSNISHISNSSSSNVVKSISTSSNSISSSNSIVNCNNNISSVTSIIRRSSSPSRRDVATKRSPERPPRSIEQPQAKSAFSRPKQSKATTIHSSSGNSSYETTSSSSEQSSSNGSLQLIQPTLPPPPPPPQRPSCIAPPNNDVQLFRDRSAAETEAAHDLLELSRSLPPLAPPSVAIGPQSVIEHPASDIQEMTVYQPPPGEQQLYQVDLATTALYHSQSQHPHIHQPSAHPASIIYEPTTLLHASHGGVFIPLSPVQEVLFYSGPAIPTTMIAQPLQPQLQPLIPPQQPSIEPIIIQQQLPAPQQQQHQQQQQPVGPQPMVIESSAPLTPPTSECSSDVENSNPNLQPSQRDKEVQTNVTLPESVESAKTASYTFDTLIVADGRTKKCKQPAQPTAAVAAINAQESVTANVQDLTAEANRESSDQPETSKTGKYVCSECGKQYATSSNLSRHKQTHRSIDSQSAKKCIHCGKAYVSMPALAMHVLTHKLTHSCGVCGKMFSRPWLLQGHLRSHTGEKPYGCAHCGKAFADRSNLRAHMQTHSTDKNHECSRCHKTFALKSYLNKHLESACQRDNDESSNDADSPA